MNQLEVLKTELERLHSLTEMHQRNATLHKYTPDEYFYSGILKGHLNLIEQYNKRINNLKKHLEDK